MIDAIVDKIYESTIRICGNKKEAVLDLVDIEIE